MRTSASCRLTFFAAAILAGACTFPIEAAEPFYFGTWKIDSAVPAPWVEAGRKPDPEEMKTLMGKIVVFKPTEITGPRQVACKGPRYKVIDSPAEGLFQGAFDEMHRRDASVDPVKVANKLGFAGKSWKTVETGCATELDWHFVNPTTTTFGLNDYVYFLKKQ
ncbi:MAG TPA: hypothetical protein VKU19_26145 [Bryobacteraceae bacterium]|nr:hypothetical protein [Bryobacteraceae bacterium]